MRFTPKNAPGFSAHALRLMNQDFATRVAEYEDTHFGPLDPRESFDAAVLEAIAAHVLDDFNPPADFPLSAAAARRQAEMRGEMWI
jgi:hypothetical protein